MSFRRESLSPEERDEYDLLLEEAGFDENGDERPSGEIGARIHALLEDADQAGRPWASWVLQDDAEAGHLKRFKQWDNRRKQIKVYHQGAIIPRAAVVGVRRRNEAGQVYAQRGLWAELSWSEIEQKVDEARAQKRSAAINEATGRKLLALREKAPESYGPQDAAQQLGIDLESYLADENVA